VAAHARADHPPAQTPGWEHVLFHGGVPGDKRGALVDRFNNDPACRVFLSTDAGGVGLNLQHAAAVIVNMDLPWNPAVLEQRIGRVHRLDQTRGVQVINFVARGTIEEGMLSILAFKQSLFADILDGGESEVVLQGTRLSKFMETVDQVSGAAESTAPMDESSEDTLPLDAAPEAGSETEAEYRQSTPAGEADQPPVADARTGAEPPTSAPAAVSGGADPWAPLLAAGVQLLGELTAASSGERESPWVQTDSTTG
jgi:superfamily II DNA/RNA helicase